MLIQRYVCREVFTVFTGVFSVLIAIYAGMRLIRYLANAAIGSLPSDVVLYLLALKVLEDAPTLLPVSLFISMLLGLRRIYDDNEMVVMLSSGLSVIQIVAGLLWLIVGFALATLAIVLFLVPHVVSWQQTLAQQSKARAEIGDLAPGQFKQFGNGNRVVYFESVSKNDQRMHNVFVLERHQNRIRLHTAATAYPAVRGTDGTRLLVLENGRSYSGNPGEAGYTIMEAARYEVRIRLSPSPIHISPDMLPTRTLLYADDLRLQAELQGRISVGLSVFILALLAIPMATNPRRGSRYVQLFVAIVVFFIYANCINIAQKLIESEQLPTIIGVWPVHLAVAAIAGGMMIQQARGYSRRDKRRIVQGYG